MMFLHASAFLRRLFNHVVSRRRSELCQRLKHGLFLLCDDGQELRAAAGLLTRVAEEPLAVWIHTGLLQYCLQRSETRVDSAVAIWWPSDAKTFTTLLRWLHFSEPGAASVFLSISGFIVSKSVLLPWLQVQNGGVFTV